MNNVAFQSKPNAYARFKWNGQTMEGEFFQYSLSLADDTKTTKGYIRPFDRNLRQSILDAHQSNHKIDFYDFFTIEYLIECDSLVTHPDLKRPYIDVLVDDFEFTEEDDLITDKSLITNCRLDMLRRQNILARALNEPSDISDELVHEFKKWCAPDFEPLRYKRTIFTKFIQNSIIRFIGILLLLFTVVKLSN